jgi:hypothetical protein
VTRPFWPSEQAVWRRLKLGLSYLGSYVTGTVDAAAEAVPRMNVAGTARAEIAERVANFMLQVD